MGFQRVPVARSGEIVEPNEPAMSPSRANLPMLTKTPHVASEF